ncbi:MAG: EAL domain-containing protein [Candidatus Omnitrophica bacterium]|nr:EAL domain-containing protein [Candidatus Omnitrophota bacterium]MDE2214986.1 EAL domain-containing protein [Candidatus Omnitrophota bacterium]
MWMKTEDARQAGSRLVPIKIIFPYAILTLLWIYTSNNILALLFKDSSSFKGAEDLKALLYVLVTSVILYLLFRTATYRLRDSERKYRHLFDNAAVSIVEEDFSKVKEFFDRQREIGDIDWREYFQKNPQAVRQCASWVTIRDCNQEALRLTDRKSKDEMSKTLDCYFTETSYESFKEQLIALANGTTHWDGERSIASISGEPREFILRMTVMPGHEEDLSRVLVSLLDITDRRKDAKTIELNEQRLRQIIDLVPHFIFAKNIEGRFVLGNKAIADAYGTTVEGLVGKKDEDFIKSRTQVRHFLKDDLEVMRSGKSKFIPLEPITDTEGRTRFLATTKVPFTASGIDSPCVLGVAVDITEYQQAQEALAQGRHFIESVLNATPSLIYVYDLLEKKNIYCNRGLTDLLGYTQQAIEEMEKELFDNILHPDDYAAVMEHHQLLAQDGRVREIEYRMKDAQGAWHWLRSRDVVFSRTPSGKPWQILGSAEDVTEHKQLENKFWTLSYYDAVTTFPNRTLFFERANLGLSHARRGNISCAILFVDLDHFKNVNDTLGHSVGDELLKDTAVRLAECVREVDTIARLGADKFIVFLNGLEDAQSSQHIAERIREKMNCSRMILDHDLFITASVGIATFPEDGDNLEELLKNADTAMNAAKDAGRNAFCFFNGTMNDRAVARMQIERGLRGALAKNEFKLYYQPIVAVADGAVRGFEVLLRWFKSDGTLVYPNDFIGIAEETGLIVAIGEWVLKEACRTGQKLHTMGFDEIVMSVNISVVQLRTDAIIPVISNALLESGFPPEFLEIEVTESIFIGSFDASIEILQKIRDMGVRVALDDFGTGYSSLSHLQRLPITTLKIDRFFIKELMNEGVEMAMTATIIELAHHLNLGVIAEGVEHDHQLKNLARKQCDYFQGFLFGKPMPEEQALAFLKNNMEGNSL